MHLTEAVLLRRVAYEWGVANGRYFRYALAPPAFRLGEATTRLGAWHRISRTIELSRELVATQPWGVVVEVLKHEMAHQYAHEVLGALDETAHGEAFARACARMGLDPAASGVPTAAPDPERDRVLAKIQRLLALATSPNANEAQAAANAAQRLMLKHNVDRLEAAAAGRRYGFRRVGEARARFGAHEKVLGGLLARYFFVQALWVHDWLPQGDKPGRVLELCGTEDNLEIAAWVHDWLLDTAERLWRAHKRSRGAGAGSHQRFLLGVMTGFGEKLREQERANREEGLVWVGDPGLDAWFHARHPLQQTGRRIRTQADSAWHSGRAAGKEIVLQRVVKGDATTRGRLLTGG